MNHHFHAMQKPIALLLLAAICSGALAQEASIRKKLGRLPDFANIDSVSKTAMPGLYEVRVHKTDIFYTDAEGNFLVQGNLFETRNMRNITKERVDKLQALKFEELPFKDAFTLVKGNGQRKLAIFEDPNCGYCKKFEKDFQNIDNVTVHVFLYPILGPDSKVKSKNIWCANDRAAAWTNWILRDAPSRPLLPCDSTALERNLDFGRRYRIEGTPTLILADGTRVPGASDAAQIEKLLSPMARQSVETKVE